jgi:hypothetical protein
MSYATFNGWTIIPPPASPGFRSIVLRINDTVAEARSPFTAMSQVQEWPGADWWEAEIEMPPLCGHDTAAWRAWLMALQGKKNVFQIGDQSQPMPLNPVTSSTPVCATSGGANLTGAVNLVTRGWRASQARILVPGDYLQVGYRLHAVLQPVSTDSGGNATINIGPSLRESPADGTPIILNQPKGLFRLADNARSISIAVTRLAAVGFKCVEAR